MPAGHDVSELLAVIGAAFVTSGDRAGIPGVGSYVIEGNAFALFVEIGKIGFPTGESLFSGETDEPCGFGVVALDGDAAEIEIGKTVLGISEFGISRGTKPSDGLRIVAGSAGAEVVESGEVGLADGIAVLGGEEIPLESFTKIFGDTLTVLVKGS